MTTPPSKIREFLDAIGGMTPFEFATQFPTDQPTTGCEVSTQMDADQIIAGMLRREVAHHLVWAELREYVDFRPWLDRIDWLILSGSPDSPTDLDWLRRVIADCRAAGVPVWLRSVGSRPVYTEKTPNMRATFAYMISDPTGSDPAEWPADLRGVRDVPAMLGEGV